MDDKSMVRNTDNEKPSINRYISLWQAIVGALMLAASSTYTITSYMKDMSTDLALVKASSSEIKSLAISTSGKMNSVLERQGIQDQKFDDLSRQVSETKQRVSEVEKDVWRMKGSR